MKAPSSHRPRTQHKPSRRTTTQEREGSTLSTYLPRLLRAIAIGLLVAIASATVLALLGAALLSALPDPDTPLLPVSLVILLLAALLLGGTVGKQTGEHLLLGGMLCGALLLGVMFVLSYPFSASVESALPASLALPLRGAVLLFALLGSYLGGHLPSRRTRRQRAGRR